MWQGTITLGHRGVPMDFQENTMEGFLRAIELEIPGVELDVLLTKDGKVVVCHDEELERLTGNPGRVSKMTWEEVSQRKVQRCLDMGAKQPHEYASELPLVLLDDVLREVQGRLIINVEMKPESHRRLGNEVAKLIRSHDAATWAFTTSFSPLCLRRLEKEEPKVESGFAYDDFNRGSILRRIMHWAAEKNLVGRWINSTVVDLDFILIDDDTVAKYHGRNMKVGAYTLFPLDQRHMTQAHLEKPHDELLEELVGLGVDWIETDDPKKCHKAIVGLTSKGDSP